VARLGPHCKRVRTGDIGAPVETVSITREKSMLAPESILSWILIGAVAGWLAGRLIKGYGFGLIGNIVIGILGAGVAGLLAPRLGLHTESFGGNVVASLLGALVLLLLIGLVRRT